MIIEEARPTNYIDSSNQIQSSKEKYDKVNPNSVADLKISSKGAKVGYNTPDDVMNAENSGTTIRLLSAVCSFVNDGFTVLTGDKSLRTRPMGDLINSLKQVGVKCFSTKPSNTPPLIVKGGGIKGGEVLINGQISSQFVSSLLLSGIFAKEKVTIKVLGKQVSKPYIISTMAVMKKFGVEIDHKSFDISEDKLHNYAYSNYNINSDLEFIPSKRENKNNIITELYNIPNEKDYNPITFKIPGDFSTAALLLASAVLSNGRVTINNLNFTLPQGDYNIVNILRKMGADLTADESNGSLSINGSNILDGGEYNLRDTPDLLPVLAILSLKCKNPVKISGISHARYKETDRVSNISSQLVKLGADIKEEFDSLLIVPPIKIKNAVLDSFNDHRLFMAFFIASLATDESTIEGVESVDVSYPSFIDDMRKIGAKICN
jgi:3-phosphoshikimate 1-carboxyvinyltransferase